MSPAVDVFLAQLGALCREYSTAPKWLIVPSHSIGLTVTERLAREGVAWANLRCTVPRDLAVAMAAPALLAGGFDPAPDRLGPALVMRLLLDLPATVPPYFRPLADQPNMADALWSTIRELRLAGVTASNLPGEAFAIPQKHAELRALLASYEGYLSAHRLADDADVYCAALLELEACPIGPSDVRIELPGVAWSPLERRLLDALPGRLVPSHTLESPVPRRFGLLGSRSTRVPAEPASDAERLRFLMDPAAAPPPRGDDTVAMFRAAGREAEIEHVMRLVASGRQHLDDVEIACTAPDQALVIRDKAARHGWPVTLSAGVPAVQTRPGRAFLGWAERRFPAGALRRLFQSGDVTLVPDEPPSPGQAARLLARSGATWDRATYARALEALAAESERRAAGAEQDDDAAAAYRERARQARKVGEVIQALLALVPLPDERGNVELGAVLAGSCTLLERHAAVTSDVDAAARCEGLHREALIVMPANNLSLVYRKG